MAHASAGPAPSLPLSGTEKVVQFQVGVMKATPSGRRGQHPKQHGCVTADFEVLADIPARCKVGLFATPARYKALIRFSNGRESDDTRKDIHGMAIKLLGVPGAKVLDEEASATTHDFILADNPVFLIRDTVAYVQFTDALKTTPRGEPPKAYFQWLTDNNRAEEIRSRQAS